MFACFVLVFSFSVLYPVSSLAHSCLGSECDCGRQENKRHCAGALSLARKVHTRNTHPNKRMRTLVSFSFLLFFDLPSVAQLLQRTRTTSLLKSSSNSWKNTLERGPQSSRCVTGRVRERKVCECVHIEVEIVRERERLRARVCVRGIDNEQPGLCGWFAFSRVFSGSR